MTDWFTLACAIIGQPEPDEVLEGFDRLILSLDRQAEAAARVADELAVVREGMAGASIPILVRTQSEDTLT